MCDAEQWKRFDSSLEMYLHVGTKIVETWLLKMIPLSIRRKQSTAHVTAGYLPNVDSFRKYWWPTKEPYICDLKVE